jgi:hypothetical protein|tara:strand:+ start:518 stop:694 length:177 start_codon:yes stop_codon:yes gene_type:complete
MAKITNYIPEPTPEYDPNNQQQVLQSLETMKNQLNFTFQEELKQEVERVGWYNMRFGC